MRTMFVVPIDEENKLAAEVIATQGNNDLANPFLHGSNESFDDGNTSVFADGTEPRFNAFALAPFFATLTRPKLATFVADQVFRFRFGS